MMFCSNRRRAETALSMFQKLSLQNNSDMVIQMLCGTMMQSERQEALMNLRSGHAKITIATDLAARGIDASGVDLVIHIDGASDWRTHQHRVGRGGRLGSFAVSIVIMVENLDWDVELKNQLGANGIVTPSLALDESKKMLPLPAEIIDHILNSGRSVYNKPKAVERGRIVKSEGKCCFSVPSLDVGDFLIKFEEYDDGLRKQKRVNKQKNHTDIINTKNPEFTEFNQVLNTFQSIFERIQIPS